MKNLNCGIKTYCNINTDENYPREGTHSELQPYLKKAYCHVCALGAAMISHVRLFDNFKVDDAPYGIIDGDTCRTPICTQIIMQLYPI